VALGGLYKSPVENWPEYPVKKRAKKTQERQKGQKSQKKTHFGPKKKKFEKFWEIFADFSRFSPPKQAQSLTEYGFEEVEKKFVKSLDIRRNISYISKCAWERSETKATHKGAPNLEK
jgi:hypothetical protein